MTSDPELTTDDLARSGSAGGPAVGADDHAAVDPAAASASDPWDDGPRTGSGTGTGAMGGQGVPAHDAATLVSGTGATVPGATAEEPGLGQGGYTGAGTGTGTLPPQPVGIGQEAGSPTAAETGYRTSAEGSATGDGRDVALLDPAEGARFRQRWSDVQARFVDDPQESVKTADGLVAELMQSLAQGFSQHKGRLESAWQRGGNPDTEDLRQALQRYRSFFDRLLST